MREGLPFAYLAWGLAGLVVAALGWVVLDLFVIRSAQIKTSVAGITVRVRCASWVNAITGSDATVIRDVIHLKRGVHRPSIEFLADEMGHVYQWKRHGVIGFIVRFIRERSVVESEAHGPLGYTFLFRPDLATLRTAIVSRYDGSRTTNRGNG